jgi:hypothetical protein
MAGGLGKTAVKDDLLRQMSDTIIANMIWVGRQFKNIKMPGFMFPRKVVTVHHTWITNCPPHRPIIGVLMHLEWGGAVRSQSLF